MWNGEQGGERGVIIFNISRKVVGQDPVITFEQRK